VTFNAAALEAARLTPRTAQVPVPGLAPFFSDGDEHVWHVRGLTSVELHRALEAGKRQGAIESVVRAIAASGDQAQAVRKALGLTADTPGEVAKRLEMLVMGSTEPNKVELPVAVKLAEGWPVEFLQITNTISELTGLGADVVKPSAASLPTAA
jgi:hypothetical protein